MKRTLGNGLNQKALFLDRDGVVNVNHGYVHTKEAFQFIEGIFELCRAATAKGYRIFIVTNQSGIARGYYSQKDFSALSRWLEHRLWLHGIAIDHTYHCPHHPQQQSKYGITCTCRKPKPGMLFRAQRDFGINLKRSIMVGDSLSDIQCATRAGLQHAILYGPAPHPWWPALAKAGGKPYYRASHLRAIIPLL